MNPEAIGQALEVERFIARCRVEGDHGPVWNRTADGARPRFTLYHGSAGIILFYLACMALTWWAYSRRNAPHPC